jgi:hypothetical protein
MQKGKHSEKRKHHNDTQEKRYLMTIESGWIVKKYEDGSIERISKMDTAIGPYGQRL